MSEQFSDTDANQFNQLQKSLYYICLNSQIIIIRNRSMWNKIQWKSLFVWEALWHSNVQFSPRTKKKHSNVQMTTERTGSELDLKVLLQTSFTLSWTTVMKLLRDDVSTAWPKRYRTPPISGLTTVLLWHVGRSCWVKELRWRHVCICICL